MFTKHHATDQNSELFYEFLISWLDFRLCCVLKWPCGGAVAVRRGFGSGRCAESAGARDAVRIRAEEAPQQDCACDLMIRH